MSWVITGAEKTPVDLYRSNVSLLLHGNADGSGNILDSSPSPKTVSKFGNAASATPPSYPNSNSLFGNAIAFDGTGDYLSVPNTADFQFESGDFTVETWIYTASSLTQAICGKETAGGAAFLFHLSSNTLKINLSSNGSSYSLTLAGTTNLALNTWHHVVVVRSGSSANNIKLYTNGSQDGQGTFSGTIFNDSSLFTVGYRQSASALFFNGYIDDLRITKGVARYTSNFTPPTAPFPDI